MIPRVDPPQDLRSDVNADFLRRLLNELPVAVLSLPPRSVSEPWWLAFVAHEVGHHVQFDLLPDAGLTRLVPGLIEAVAGERWKAWHEEIFADLYSVLMIGPWAGWVLAELVWGDDRAMLNDANPRYPAPVVRLMFMSEIARKLNVDPAPALRGIVASELLSGPAVGIGRPPHNARETIADDLSALDTLTSALLEPVPGLGASLPALSGFEHAEFTGRTAAVEIWSQVLRGQGTTKVRQALRSARVVIAAAVKAWAAISELQDDADREVARCQLKERTLTTIAASREEETRAFAPAPLPRPGGASDRRLLDLLMREAPAADGT
jgi:hypothetical protein